MVDAGTPGRIVNITSVHEHIPLPQAAAYCAAKGGLGLLTKVMALELGEHGITVNAIAPGEIATPMTGAHDVDPSDEERPRCRSGGRAAHTRSPHWSRSSPRRMRATPPAAPSWSTEG